jgi:deazaflavin-dependent oxidoreductase (nitroreductase family)
LLWRLGLGPVIGRLFMIMTTTGRVSGLPRRTAIEFHEIDGRPCVLANWPQSNWLRNLAANPILTVQTWRGAQVMRARADGRRARRCLRCYPQQPSVWCRSDDPGPQREPRGVHCRPRPVPVDDLRSHRSGDVA